VSFLRCGELGGLLIADVHRPNYGRNSTAVFALSSGTIGGAMEASICGKRAIALSYAFLSRNHDPVVIKGASLMSVKIVEHLAKNWTEGVDLYSVNVPLIEGIDGDDTKVLYTHMLQNYWETGSSFEEMEVDEVLSPEESEAEIREGVHGEKEGRKVGYGHKKFRWAPRFGGVFASVERVSSHPAR
jgi:tubulin--tyrosine ligase